MKVVGFLLRPYLLMKDSLDAETLDTAITTLIELQSYGRNIGIISHVSELKERIRPKLEVYSKNNYAKVKISGV